MNLFVLYKAPYLFFFSFFKNRTTSSPISPTGFDGVSSPNTNQGMEGTPEEMSQHEINFNYAKTHNMIIFSLSRMEIFHGGHS